VKKNTSVTQSMERLRSSNQGKLIQKIHSSYKINKKK
jgi:hypothetical protein